MPTPPFKEAGDLLADLRERKGLTQEQLGASVGVSARAISHYEAGMSWPRKAEVRAKLKKAGFAAYVQKAWTDARGERDEDELTQKQIKAARELAGGEARPLTPDEGYVPVVGAAACGAWIEALENGRQASGEKWYEHVGKHARVGRFGVIAKGESMTGAGYEDGDVLVVDAVAEPVHGKNALVFVDGEVTVKEYRRYGDRVVLRAKNPEFEPQEIELEPEEQEERITWARPIVFHKPRGRE